mgnify:CR=1 FL=1
MQHMTHPWENKITHYSDEPPEQLLGSPFNWRTHPAHQQNVLAGTLGDIGWLVPIICNEVTGHIVDGHMRAALALRHDMATVPVAWVRLTEAEEKLAIASIDPIAALAGADQTQLAALLTDIHTTDAAVTQMLQDVLTHASPFHPNLTPGSHTSGVTDAQLAQAGGALHETIHAHPPLIPVTCPHCLQDFLLDKAHL